MIDVTVKRTDFKQAAADASEKYKGSLDMIERGVDYNDGNWHGWNGGECPVHPKSVVEVELFSGCRDAKYDSAGLYSWTHIWAYPDDNIVKFRVTRRYVEPPKPREFWIVETDGTPRTFYNEGIAKKYAGDFGFYVIHVREVIEE